MTSYPWNCCRMCLSVQSLYPIFTLPEHRDRYSSIIFGATGLKVDINDDLPQTVCSPCITFINESMKFRRKCDESHKILTNKLNSKSYCDIKIEPHVAVKHEFATSIDISLTDDEEFKDEDDNVTLDSLKSTVEKNVTEEQTICETEDLKLEQTNKRRVRNNENSKPKRTKKVTEKKEKSKERERVKEEIECEYCHKILTSRLSLRNHYKIHTGFDVVCEHCGKKFITRRLLLMHCRAKHGYEKTDKCSYCDYKASNAEQVKIHERLHTGERPYVCKECNAGFHRQSSYLQHVAIHLPEKTVQCDQCPARFKSVTLMRIHKNRHRGPQYQFQCGVCRGSFARRRNVTRHLLRVHGLAAAPAHVTRVKVA